MSRRERYVRVDGPMPELAKDTWRNLARAEDNLKRDGRIAVPEAVHGQHAMRPYYAQLMDLYALRNLAAARPVRRREFRLLFESASELATMTIDGEVAAWDLLRQDGNTCKVLAGQMVPDFEGYRPGRLLEAWLLERAWRNPFVTWLDWGDDHPETLLKLK